MISSKICLVTRSAIRDANTNEISLFGLVEDLGGGGFPLFIPNLDFFVLWEREEADESNVGSNFSIKMNDNVLLTKNIRIDFENKIRNRTTVHVNGLVIPQPGLALFEIVLDSGSRASYSVNIKSLPTTALTRTETSS